MKIVVVIVNFNSGDLLTRCINHLLDQTRPADIIMVVDNASEDQSATNLPDCPRLTVHHLQENIGFAGANNVALEQASDADYFITLNPDAFVEADFIEQLEQAALANPHYASFASRMMRNEVTMDGAGDAYHISGIAWRKMHAQPYLPEQHQTQEVFAPCAGAAMYKAADLFESGGFDDAFFCYMEDIDLGFRLQLRGKRCLYVPDATVTHLGSAITGKYPGFAFYHGHRNTVWVMVKNTPGLLLPFVLPLHFLLSIVMCLVFLTRGQLRQYLRAKFDAIGGLGRVWKQRKLVQESRLISIGDTLKIYSYDIKR